VALGSTIVKRSAPVALSIFIGAGTNTLLNFVLIPQLGRDGAAVATFAAYLVAAIYLYFASQRNYAIPYRPLDPLVCLGFAALLMTLNRLFLPSGSFWAYLVRASMCLLFIPLAFALRIVVPNHLRQLRSYLGQRAGHVHARSGQAL
jgi:O-antigen/teichoic acid export membrane protein